MNTDNYSRLVTLAEGAGLSVTALCRLAGVAPSTVTRWRSGKTQPTFRIWEKIERAAHGDQKK
jgi:transcriptional regulator with XRE-family HTH domain